YRSSTPPRLVEYCSSHSEIESVPLKTCPTVTCPAAPPPTLMTSAFVMRGRIRDGICTSEIFRTYTGSSHARLGRQTPAAPGAARYSRHPGEDHHGRRRCRATASPAGATWAPDAQRVAGWMEPRGRDEGHEVAGGLGVVVAA